MKCLTSSLWSTPRREFQQPFASLSRSALRPGQPVVPHHQPITPAWDTEPGIDEDKARRNKWIAARAPRVTPLTPGVPITGMPRNLRGRVAVNDQVEADNGTA